MIATPATCPVCAQALVPYAVGESDEYRFISCRACGSILTAPWPSAQTRDQYYGDFQPEAVHAPNPERDIAYIAKVLRKTLPTPVAGKNRLIDINAERGYTVAAAQQLGWNATGLNTQEYLHRFASTHYGAQNFVESDAASFAAQTSEKADVIIASNAFTQQSDLDAFTAALSSLLAPGGAIYIEEPDGNHFNTPNDISSWAVVEPPATCATVSKKGLGKLLARHGLGFKKNYFTWVPFIRALAGHARKK